jgi:hypothetical protein
MDGSHGLHMSQPRGCSTKQTLAVHEVLRPGARPNPCGLRHAICSACISSKTANDPAARVLLGVIAISNTLLSYDLKLWMRDLIERAAYLPD